MTAHTPGPWTVKPVGLYWSVNPDRKGDRMQICKVAPRFVNSGCQGHANACLIAAAPDLLAALENLLTAIEPDNFTREVTPANIDTIRGITAAAAAGWGAIAKATA